MSTSTEKFREYIERNPVNYEAEDMHSLVEYFGRFYRMRKPINPENIRDRFQELDPIMKSLSRKRERRLFDTVLELCEEYERAAFMEGLRVGAQLMLELSESE